MRRKELFYLALGVALLGMATGLFVGAGMMPQRAAAAMPSAGSTAQARPETLVVHLYFKNTVERDYLAQEWGAAEMPTAGGYLTVWVDRPGYNQMIAQGLKVEIDEATTRLANDPHLFGNSPNTFYNGYKTVEEMQTFLDQQVAAHPTLAAKVDIGDSWCKVNPGCTLPAPYSGYDIWALHITNQAIAGPKPVFWYDAGIHAREIAVPEVAMLYISWLLDGYDSDADAHWMVDYQDIWVIPMFNPDGHHIVESGGGGNNPYYQRKNSNNTNGCTSWPPTVSTQFGTDSNRNFPFKFACCGGSSGSPCTQTYRGPVANSEPETQAVVNQVRLLIPDQRGPNDTDPAPITTTGIYQNMHSNGALNLYPWGFSGSPSPNNAELANIGKHMQAANASPSGNSYTACQPPNCLYAVDGDANDWAYGELGAASYTTEVGGSDFLVPIAYTTGTLWPANRGALIYQGKIARTPYLLAHGPDTSAVTLTPMTVTVGTSSQLAASINFAWTSNSFAQNVGAAEYYIDTPPWAGGTALPMTGAFGTQTVAVQATVDTTSLSTGRHIIFVRGRGVTDFSGYQTWGPVTAGFLWVQPSQGTPTPTVTGTPPTATRTATVVAASPTATCVGGASSWTAGPPLFVPNVRGVGVVYPGNSRFYVLAGRVGDTAGDDNQSIFEYNPATNSWTTKAATLPTNRTNNGVGAVLTFTGTQYVVQVGGSNCCGATALSTGDVRLYNPTADTLVTLGTDPWPAGAISSTVPGGGAVYNNKLYIFGGFDITGGGTGVVDNIWEMDPARPAGSRWVLKNAHLPTALGYVPVATLGNFIYTGGGATFASATLADTQLAYRYDPVADTISVLPNIPTATSNVKAIAFNGQVWVLGGGFTAPNPTNMVQAYDPGTNTWSNPNSYTNARRNQPADTDGTHIYMVGGYEGGAPANDMEIYGPGGGCGGATPSPTAQTTATRTATRTATTAPTQAATSTATATVAPTTCPVQFQDVPVGSTFYEFIRCLACRGIVNGYPCGGPGEPCPGSFFRPNNNVTRGQVSKIVSESAGFSNAIPSTQWTFQDVPPSGTFWLWVERLSGRGIIGGYPCGGALEPCVAPGNRPYFRPNNDVTRGQLSKIVSGAAGWTETPTGQTFQDVAPGSTFWLWIERVASRGIVAGYPCGGTGEPCVAPGNKPYFRPNNNATRGQMSKIAASAFFPGCSTPAQR